MIVNEPIETRKALQNQARHLKIKNLYADILFDIRVCEIEGWDKTEYIRMLQDCLNSFKIKKIKKN